MEQKPIDIRKLDELLSSGVCLEESLREIGEDRPSYVIVHLSEIKKSNTRTCPLSEQYSGCFPKE